MTRYSSKQEAIQRGIITPLGDENPENYDIEAIFREAFEWRINHNEHGQELLNTAGFEQAVSDDEFWVVVEHHEK